LAALVGAVGWIVLVLPIPDRSFEPVDDRGLTILFSVLPLAALALGLTWPEAASTTIGASLVAGPLAMAPWTAPRYDEDGLWVLVFPSLLVWGVVCAVLAAAGGFLRRRSVRRSD
jgi:hypothetical protein